MMHKYQCELDKLVLQNYEWSYTHLILRSVELHDLHLENERTQKSKCQEKRTKEGGR